MPERLIDRFDVILLDMGNTFMFDVLVFSSDHACVKPSPRLFGLATDAFDVERTQMVFVGDNQKRDVAGAKAVGLAAVWISPDGQEPDPVLATPDLIISDLRDLLQADGRT